MLAWTFTAANACIFYERCIAANAVTEKEKTDILLQMAKEGLIQNVVQTNMSKDAYVKHLSKNFKVAVIKDK